MLSLCYIPHTEKLIQVMVQSRLKIVLAEHNLQRARQGKPALSIRELATATGLASSTITGLTGTRSQGISFETLSALCTYFQRPPGDFFLYTPDDDEPSS